MIEHHAGGDHTHPIRPPRTYLTFEQLDEQLAEAQLHRAADAASPLARILAEQVALVEHQWRNGVVRGLVRGFVLSGPPGAGKTTLAKRLGHELGRRFPRRAGRDGVATVVLDGSDIARAKYGETERRIREIFEAAETGLGTAGQRTVLVFDDVESILMARGSAQSKEWHYSQDSVFFHEIDDLDTSRTTVVLTTNRPDLVDDAVLDRFLHYRVPRPTADELVAVAVSRLRAQHLGGLDELAARVRAASADGDVRSFRQAEHLALRWHVARVTGHAFTNEAETGE